MDYILDGGVAMGAHGLLRTTEDIDLFVRPSPDNVQRLRHALRMVWDDPEVEGITVADLSGEYTTIRYGPPGETFVIDFISRLGSAFSYDDLESEVIVLEGSRRGWLRRERCIA